MYAKYYLVKNMGNQIDDIIVTSFFVNEPQDFCLVKNYTASNLVADSCSINAFVLDDIKPTEESNELATNNFLLNFPAISNLFGLSSTPNIAEELGESISSLNKFTGDYVTIENLVTVSAFAFQGYLTHKIGGLNAFFFATHAALTLSQLYIDSMWDNFCSRLEEGLSKDILSTIKMGKFLTLLSSTQLGISNGVKAYSLLKDSYFLRSVLNSETCKSLSSLPVLKSFTYDHFQSITAKPASVMYTDYLSNKLKPIFWGTADGVSDYFGYEFQSQNFTVKPLDIEKAILDVIKKLPEIIAKNYGASMPIYIAAGESVKDLWQASKSLVAKNDLTISSLKNISSIETLNTVISYNTVENTRDFFLSISLKGSYETLGRVLAPKYATNHMHSLVYLTIKESMKIFETTVHDKICQKKSCWKSFYYLTGFQYNDDLDNIQKADA